MFRARFFPDIAASLQRCIKRTEIEIEVGRQRAHTQEIGIEMGFHTHTHTQEIEIEMGR